MLNRVTRLSSRSASDAFGRGVVALSVGLLFAASLIGLAPAASATDACADVEVVLLGDGRTCRGRAGRPRVRRRTAERSQRQVGACLRGELPRVVRLPEGR